MQAAFLPRHLGPKNGVVPDQPWRQVERSEPDRWQNGGLHSCSEDDSRVQWEPVEMWRAVRSDACWSLPIPLGFCGEYTSIQTFVHTRRALQCSCKYSYFCTIWKNDIFKFNTPDSINHRSPSISPFFLEKIKYQSNSFVWDWYLIHVNPRIWL